VIAMMEALRGELADANIEVSVFSPSVVNGADTIHSNRNRPANLGSTQEVAPNEKGRKGGKRALRARDGSV
jgi:hypothetical protein